MWCVICDTDRGTCISMRFRNFWSCRHVNSFEFVVSPTHIFCCHDPECSAVFIPWKQLGTYLLYVLNLEQEKLTIWHKTSLPFQHYCITIVGFHLELRSAIKQVMVFLWVIRCTIHYSYKYMFVFFESWWLLLPQIFKWETHFAIHDQSWKWLKSWHLQGE
jgi:hypothetical protein